MPGVIEFDIAGCLNMPRKRLFRLLDDVAYHCMLARNAVVQHWLRWRWENPDWKPAQARIRNGSPKVDKASKPVMEHPSMSQDCGNSLNHLARDCGRHVSAAVMSGVSSSVKEDLQARMPYNHPGKKRFRWAAVLAYECAPPSFRDQCIYVPTNASVLVYDGKANRQLSPGIMESMQIIGAHHCILRVPLLSKESGCKVKEAVLQIQFGKETDGRTDGRRRVLRRIVDGVFHLCDSQLIKKNGVWKIQLCYGVEAEAGKLDKTRVATLISCGKDARRPFKLVWPDGTEWGIGDGVPLVAEYKYLAQKSKAIRYRFKHGLGKGHGRLNFFRKLDDLPEYRDMNKRFVAMMMADILASCQKQNCGTLFYREPTMPQREASWFANDGVPFNWTNFEALLKFKCGQWSLDYDCERIGKAESKEKAGGAAAEVVAVRHLRNGRHAVTRAFPAAGEKQEETVVPN